MLRKLKLKRIDKEAQKFKNIDIATSLSTTKDNNILEQETDNISNNGFSNTDCDNTASLNINKNIQNVDEWHSMIFKWLSMLDDEQGNKEKILEELKNDSNNSNDNKMEYDNNIMNILNLPHPARDKNAKWRLLIYEVEDPEASEEEYILEEEDEAEEEEIEEVEDDEEEYDDNESQGATKKSPTSKSRAKTSGNIIMATEQMYQIALKSSISSLVPYCPREILIEISKVINMIFPKLKDHCLNIVMPNDTVKRRELAWGNVASKFQDILFPLLQAINTEQKPLLDVVGNPCEVPHDPVPSPSQTNNIMEIEPLPDNNHSGGGHTLNHAIKAYAQCRSAEKKIAKYIGPSP
ncbi:unnamed protein product [Rhizophagus irregularis]|nr:unnamed protein product [Rhizophagus irregularis]